MKKIFSYLIGTSLSVLSIFALASCGMEAEYAPAPEKGKSVNDISFTVSSYSNSTEMVDITINKDDDAESVFNLLYDKIRFVGLDNNNTYEEYGMYTSVKRNSENKYDSSKGELVNSNSKNTNSLETTDFTSDIYSFAAYETIKIEEMIDYVSGETENKSEYYRIYNFNEEITSNNEEYVEGGEENQSVDYYYYNYYYGEKEGESAKGLLKYNKESNDVEKKVLLQAITKYDAEELIFNTYLNHLYIPTYNMYNEQFHDAINEYYNFSFELTDKYLILDCSIEVSSVVLELINLNVVSKDQLEEYIDKMPGSLSYKMYIDYKNVQVDNSRYFVTADYLEYEKVLIENQEYEYTDTYNVPSMYYGTIVKENYEEVITFKSRSYPYDDQMANDFVVSLKSY